MRVCVEVETALDGRFRLKQRIGKNKGNEMLKPVNVGDRYLFYQVIYSFWEVIYQKLIVTVNSDRLDKYESVCSEDVKLTVGKDIALGIDDVKKYMKKYLLNEGPMYLGYIREQGNTAYSIGICSATVQWKIYVNCTNQICEITGEGLGTGKYEVVPVGDFLGDSVIDHTPELLRVQTLDVRQTASYTLRLSFSDASIRNYYLTTCYVGNDVCEYTIDGFIFTENIFKSAKIVVCDGQIGVVFSNGYFISNHILFYRSFRQLYPKKLSGVIYENDEIAIQRIYRTPLRHKGWTECNRYWGTDEEYFGPGETLLNDSGERITPLSFFEISRANKGDCFLVKPQPLDKFGYIRKDGSWLVPPIYDSAEHFNNSCALAVRKIDGKNVNYLVTKSGRQINLDYKIDNNKYCNGLCPFNAVEWNNSKYPTPCEFDGLSPGLWGYLDREGNIAITPQYVYASAFGSTDGNHAFVAKFVNGKLAWGLIDAIGNETIPCEHYCLSSKWGDSVKVLCEESDLYGLMDFEGKWILKPKFEYIEEYNFEYRLITYGTDEEHLGVYSLDMDKTIIPLEYDCIEYGKHMISCEITDTCKDRYFDYAGKELHFGNYDRVYEDGEYLEVWCNGKCGRIDLQGKEIIPCVYSDRLTVELYERGFCLVKSGGYRGLYTITGREILPPIYSQVNVYDYFIRASIETSGNWSIRDTLFTLDGTPVLSGCFRNIHVREESISAETPLGIKTFLIR